MILIDLCGNIRLYSILFFITLPLPPNSILFPYTTLFRSRMFENYQGPFYVFIGINRNQEAIENVSFDLSLFNKDDHLIWDDKDILLTDDDVGTIPKDTVFPILVPLNKNTMNKIKKVDFKDLNMSISDLHYETAGL